MATPVTLLPLGIAPHLRPLPSVGITRHPRYFRPLRHPAGPTLALAGCRLARATPPDRASRVASIPLFHACCRHYPGGTCRCVRRSLPDRWQPSPISRRVGFRIERFGACSAFTGVAARMVAKAALGGPLHRSASDDVVTSIIRSDCYRLERQLPGGIRTR